MHSTFYFLWKGQSKGTWSFSRTLVRQEEIRNLQVPGTLLTKRRGLTMWAKIMDAEAICLGFKSWVIHLIAWWPLVSYLPSYLMCRMNWIPTAESQGGWEGRVCGAGQKSTIFHPHRPFWNVFPDISSWLLFQGVLLSNIVWFLVPAVALL